MLVFYGGKCPHEIISSFLLLFSGSFTHDDFKEPIDIALDLDDNVVVADNGLGSVLVFETSGKLLRNIGSRGQGRGQFFSNFNFSSKISFQLKFKYGFNILLLDF